MFKVQRLMNFFSRTSLTANFSLIQFLIVLSDFIWSGRHGNCSTIPQFNQMPISSVIHHGILGPSFCAGDVHKVTY